MKIIVDASRTLHPQPTGIERYCLEIIRALLALPEAKAHDWILVSPNLPDPTHTLHRLPSYATWRVVPGKRAWTWFHVSWFFLTHPGLRSAVFFVPGHTLPLVSPTKSVVVIHDFAFRYFRTAYGRMQAWWLNHELRRSIAKAAAIITPSETTKTDLIKLYRQPAATITVVSHGVDQQQFEPLTKTEAAKLPEVISQARPYFLVLGRVEERKNCRRILEAYRAFRTQSNSPIKLVFVGAPGYGWSAIQTDYQALPTHLKPDICFVGYQSNQLATLWLRSAEALIFPSLYEGFGLPILEAQMASVPVLTANTSSLPEVGGDAAIYVDPFNSTAIADGLTQLVTDRKLRQTIITNGQKNAAQLTWQKAAQQTLATLLATDPTER